MEGKHLNVSYDIESIVYYLLNHSNASLNKEVFKLDLKVKREFEFEINASYSPRANCY